MTPSPFRLALAAVAIAAFARAPLAADGHSHGGATAAPTAAATAASTAAATPGASPYATLAPFRCAGATLRCATAATPAWAADGTLWLAWTADGAVAVASSRDEGRTFGAPVIVGRHGDRLDVGPDARPQILVDAAGRITVVYGVFRDDHWNAEVLVARSVDAGRTFSPPRPIGPNPASQRFPAVALDASGALFVAWIDKRLVAAAAKQGRRLQGASVAYAWSDDPGTRFTAPAIAHAESCECCRLGVAFAGPGRPVVLFRDVLGQKVRDHALVAFTARDRPGPLVRVAADDWATDACPHHGPSLAIDGEGAIHAAWFTDGRARSGTFYAHSIDGGRAFSEPMAIGRPDRRAGRPALLAAGRTVRMAWKEFDGETTTVHTRVSSDAGATWSAPREIARTANHSDHPLLTHRGAQAFLSWLTRDEGYRLMPLP